jgi:hypothetical protein
MKIALTIPAQTLSVASNIKRVPDHNTCGYVTEDPLEPSGLPLL